MCAMMTGGKKKSGEGKVVLVGTFRPQNAEWVKSRRLYNLPLPSCGAVDFHKRISRIVLIAEGFPSAAYAATFREVVDGGWLKAEGYKVAAKGEEHSEAYALYELGEKMSVAAVLSDPRADVYVASSRCPSVKIDAAFYDRPYPRTGGKSMPYVFDCLKPYFRKWKSATTFNPEMVDSTLMSEAMGSAAPCTCGDEFIRSRIISIRGVQGMLDSDLALLYGVETKVLNQSVRRNIERFPQDFMFQLTGSEWREAQNSLANLKSQSVTSSWGGARKLPFMFTENGIAMLSGVLRSRTAIEINIQIMRVFVAIRRFAIANMGVLQRLGALEVKQTVMDEKLNRVLGQIDCKEFPPERIFFDGHEYDAYAKIVEFIRKAKRDIVIIDAYADNVALQILEKKRPGVTVTIVKGPHARLTALDVSKFNAQFANALTVRTSAGFHDRFIIIDQSLLLHVGASLNNIGKKCFAISVLDAVNIPSIMQRI